MRKFGCEFEYLVDVKEFAAFVKRTDRALYNNVLRGLGILGPDYMYEGWEFSFANEFVGSMQGEKKYGKALLKAMGLPGWRIDEDVTIDSGKIDEGTEIGMEFVTSILEGKSGFAQLEKFIDQVGYFVRGNRTTGFHIHIDARDLVRNNNFSELAKKAIIALFYYNDLEDVFDTIVRAHRREKGVDSARPITRKVIETAIDSYGTALEKNLNVIQKLLTSVDRNHKINYTSLIKYGTIEFRQIHSTTDLEVIKNWIKVAEKFVDLVADTGEKFDDFFLDLENIAKDSKGKEGLDPDRYKNKLDSLERLPRSKSGLPKGLPAKSINTIRRRLDPDESVVREMLTRIIEGVYIING